MTAKLIEPVFVAFLLHPNSINILALNAELRQPFPQQHLILTSNFYFRIRFFGFQTSDHAPLDHEFNTSQPCFWLVKLATLAWILAYRLSWVLSETLFNEYNYQNTA